LTQITVMVLDSVYVDKPREDPVFWSSWTR